MKKAVLILTLLLFCTFSTSSNDSVIKMLKYTHVIEQSTLFGSGLCSATAIGPHALLTASHCEEPTEKIAIDEDDFVIEGLIRDGSDHTILLVDDTFKDYAKIDKDPTYGDEVEMIGNPHGKRSVYRKGVVAKIEEPDDNPFAAFFGQGGPSAKVIYLDLNAFPGDSGAALFNKDQKIVGVLSFTLPSPKESEGKLAGGFGMTFTKDQIEQALKFIPTHKPEPKDDDNGINQ